MIGFLHLLFLIHSCGSGDEVLEEHCNAHLGKDGGLTFVMNGHHAELGEIKSRIGECKKRRERELLATSQREFEVRVLLWVMSNPMT